MALINPSNLYSGGQGVLDSNRYMNFVLQQEAKKQAKQEALDAAFSERMAKLTPTGMRTEEIPALTRVKENLQTKFIKNKNAILNPSLDGGKAWQEWNSELNKGAEIIAESKAAVKPEEMVFSISKDPDKADRIDEATLAAIDKHRQPIYTIDATGHVVRNPNFKSFDVNTISFNPKAYGAKEWDDYYKRIESLYGKERKENIKFEPTKDPYLNLEISEKSFAPETLKNIADDAINDFRADKSLAYSFKKGHSILNTPIEKWSRQNAEDFEKLNAIYKQIKGKDIQEPEELHAAEILRKFTTPLVNQRTVDNEAKKEADRMKRLRISEAGKNARVKTLVGGVEVDDVFGIAKSKAKDYKVYDFVPGSPVPVEKTVRKIRLSELDEFEKQDILGKKNQYDQYEIIPYNDDEGDYLILEDDGTVKATNSIISPRRVLNSTYNRTKGKLKAEYKKEIKPEPAKVNTPLLNATKRRKG